VHCLGWRPKLTDFSCYGFGKWCDGCEPVLREIVERVIRKSKAAKARRREGGGIRRRS
jgi:hypothetical protein